MADPRFFRRAGHLTLEQVAGITGCRIGDGVDPAMIVTDVAPLDQAEAVHLSFLDNRKYLDRFAASRAGACIVPSRLSVAAPEGMALLFADQPYRAYALVARRLYHPEPPRPGLAPSAVVDPSARVDPSTEIGPGVVIGEGAEIGPACRVEANAVIGPGVVLGEGCRIGVSASLSHCLVGCRVTIYPGVRIGQDGFGFVIDPEGHIKVPQLGRVVIEDDVEIGANTTIDRGAASDTIIRRGCMIDNLVQIGHNVEIGAHSVIVAQAGIAGSTKLGSLVMVAAQAGIAGHLNIGAGARIAAQSGVFRDIAGGQEVCGAPAIPTRRFWRQQVELARLVETKDK